MASGSHQYSHTEKPEPTSCFVKSRALLPDIVCSTAPSNQYNIHEGFTYGKVEATHRHCCDWEKQHGDDSYHLHCGALFMANLGGVLGVAVVKLELG